MKLYTMFRSSAAFRVRIALNLKGIAYESIPKALVRNEHRREDFLSLNPQGLLPALAIDSTVLSQSLAIIEYLDATYPAPNLLPEDEIARAQVRSMSLAIACDVHPLNNLRVLNYLKEKLKVADDDVSAWYKHWVSEGFRGLEVMARKFSTHERHMFGDRVSLADVCLIPQMYNARRFHTDLSPYPTLVTIAAHLESLSAFAEARPEAQQDAPR